MADGEGFNALAWLRAVFSEGCTLDSSERLVMLALVHHANSATGIAWPGCLQCLPGVLRQDAAGCFDALCVNRREVLQGVREACVQQVEAVP